jgi:hypothetical protein
MGATNQAELGLYTILLGCKPKGRNVEQHDVLFGVARKLDDLSDTIKEFWYRTILSELSEAVKKVSPDTDAALLEKNLMATLSRRDKVHIDAWMRVDYVDGYKVIIQKETEQKREDSLKLFFVNLGGYREKEFEEYHKKLFMVAPKVSDVFDRIMTLDFMKEYSPEELGIAGGAHLDEQYKIDMLADDIVCVSEVIGEGFMIGLELIENHPANEMIVGYTHINYPEE